MWVCPSAMPQIVGTVTAHVLCDSDPIILPIWSVPEMRIQGFRV